jgi:uncharacterized sulfatase
MERTYNRWIGPVAVSVLFITAGSVSAQGRPSKPNFVLVLADDLGWQDVKCYDIDESSPIDTPYLDQMAQDGVMFWNAYSPAPVCSPSRGAIMSGKHPARLQRTKVNGGTCPMPRNDSNRLMDPYYRGRLEVSETTLPEVLKPLGYYTGHVGKWHIAINHGAYPGPIDHGFDFSSGTRGVTRSMDDRTKGFATTNAKDPFRLDENGMATDEVTVDAMAFMDEANNRNQPFFCYYAAWLVHSPIHCRTESLVIKYAKRMGYDYPVDYDEVTAVGQKNPYYAAMCESLDYYIHQILTYLKETDDPRWPGHKLIENTYVFFTSDNGGYRNYTDNTPLSEGKHYAEEGGVRVPFIVIGPDVQGHVKSDVMVNGLDLFPTILSLTETKKPADLLLDGADLSQLLHKDPTDPSLVKLADGSVRDTMMWHYPHSSYESTLRVGDFKLTRHYDYEGTDESPELELFQLYKTVDGKKVRVDIEESNNIAAKMPEKTRQMNRKLTEILTEMDASYPSYNPNYKRDLPNKEKAPTITSLKQVGSQVVFEYKMHGAKIPQAWLLYTQSGGDKYEEWFRIPAKLTSSTKGVAELPEGTTHCVINLIDENNFLVSYPDVSGKGKNSEKALKVTK